MQVFNDFYKGKRVLITGHGGFKGAWLAFWLIKMGANVAGYSLLVDSEYRMYDVLDLKNTIHTNIIADICNEKLLNEVINDFQPEIIFHMAAQSLVRLSYFNPVQTYTSNVIGTLLVLEAARKTLSVKAFINITTDKCYENKECDYKYQENDILGGYDMYSSSKACSEIMTSSYCRSFLNNDKSFALASARAGNVIGGGDWAKDRLIPDCIRAFYKKEHVHIRNPHAIRPWQHVLEPLVGYLLLAQNIYKNPLSYSQAYNFGPESKDTLKVTQVAMLTADYWNKQGGIASVSTAQDDNLHEAGLLQLDITKAKNELGFQPVWTAKTAIAKSTAWYYNFYNNHTDMKDYTLEQIHEFIKYAMAKNIAWSLK